MDRSYLQAIDALKNSSKTITDFISGLKNGNNGAYATDPIYAEKMQTMFTNVVNDFAKVISDKIVENNNAISSVSSNMGSYNRETGELTVEAKYAIANLNAKNEDLNKDLIQLNELK